MTAAEKKAARAAAKAAKAAAKAARRAAAIEKAKEGEGSKKGGQAAAGGGGGGGSGGAKTHDGKSGGGGGGGGEGRQPKKKLSKKERRELQEKQRAEKAAKRAAGKGGRGKKGGGGDGGKVTAVPHSLLSYLCVSHLAWPKQKRGGSARGAAKGGAARHAVEHVSAAKQNEVPLFSHLTQFERETSLRANVSFSASETIHPAILRLGLKCVLAGLGGLGWHCCATDATVCMLAQVCEGHHHRSQRSLCRHVDCL